MSKDRITPAQTREELNSLYLKGRLGEGEVVHMTKDAIIIKAKSMRYTKRANIETVSFFTNFHNGEALVVVKHTTLPTDEEGVPYFTIHTNYQRTAEKTVADDYAEEFAGVMARMYQVVEQTIHEMKRA